MSKLNNDILFLIFEELQDDSKSLFSCLMVNRLWCETVVPVLWRNPWSYSGINYGNKSSLFIIIAFYLSDDIKEFIIDQKTKLPLDMHKSLLFDYLSFCRSINVNTISNIISTGISLYKDRLIIQQKFYDLLMRKCPELKYFDMRSIKHQIFYFPEDKTCFESLCELKCDTSTDSKYFEELSRFCQHIQRLIIVNVDEKSPHGIVRLIEVQKNLKYFEWEGNLSGDNPYKKVFRALEKKANNLNHLKLFFGYVEEFEYTMLQKILTKFHKLKTLVLDIIDYDDVSFTEEQSKNLIYHDLENLGIQWNNLNVLSSIIENSGGHLKKIIFRPYELVESGDNLNEIIHNFIRKVYENCPLIEYLTISIPPLKENFTEFEKLLKVCKNLKSLLLDTYIEPTYVKSWKNGKKLLKLLNRLAPNNLKEIRISSGYKLSLKSLEEFLENWNDRPALSILTEDPIYMGEDYIKLINKYRSKGIIKDFKNVEDSIEFFYKL